MNAQGTGASSGPLCVGRALLQTPTRLAVGFGLKDGLGRHGPFTPRNVDPPSPGWEFGLCNCESSIGWRLRLRNLDAEVTIDVGVPRRLTMEPFVFRSRVTLTELTTLQARTARQLLAGLRKAPELSVYFHAHRYLEQHRVHSPEPANDFAFWARGALGDQALGEALASVDTIQYATLAGLRDALAQRLEAYLIADPLRRVAPPGQEFHFMKARTFVVPTGLEAQTLTEFREMLGRVTVHSLYFHMFEARLRLGRLTNDFSAWFQDTLQLPSLATEVARLDPYTHTLEGLRRRLAQAVDRALRSGGSHA